jgi:dTDP-glucose 4,6-dehydratase
MSETYLVAGGCGFIGSNFVHYALERAPAARVVVVDNLSFAANPANLDPVRDRVELVVGDICDFPAMLALWESARPDYVVNFAAESHNDRAVVDPSAFARTNALGAQSLLEASRRRPVRRHLHVSTIEVYGELPDDSPFFTEASPLAAKTLTRRPRRRATSSCAPTCRPTARWTSRSPTARTTTARTSSPRSSCRS